MQINVDSVHINESSVRALVELNEANPALALSLVERSTDSMKVGERKFRYGAITGLILGVVMVLCSTSVVITKGFLEGIGLFFCFMAVAAIFSVLLNGHFPDMSWLPNMLGGRRGAKKSDTQDAEVSTDEG